MPGLGSARGGVLGARGGPRQPRLRGRGHQPDRVHQRGRVPGRAPRAGDGRRQHRPGAARRPPGLVGRRGAHHERLGRGRAFVVDTLAATPPAIGALDVRPRGVRGPLAGAGQRRSRRARRMRGARPPSTWTARCGPTSGTPAWTAPEPAPAGRAATACDAFCEAATADFATVDATGPLDRAVIDGSRHMTFTDLGLLGIGAGRPGPGHDRPCCG